MKLNDLLQKVGIIHSVETVRGKRKIKHESRDFFNTKNVPTTN